ncbi:glutamine--fructose-6-phosphate transaminase (isomerizing) [Campylobacter lanienae]|uniref:glutamine--fructose-6-phosphate transaminase (isomerizing) n=1 Tax=Campylobacter lanienae TaxID=75658 RepID=UPI0024323A69|nr:glutamine--fructose-6-phosphate transaminase (isomerizing) [Campylobacter lanienae]MDD7514354.1 glutamine--fructose-6-phosphate transaminase (isomerizing) [Campylobacter lanienae]MDY5518688.1 glutamine--fructose-6-phosphate transaminase (isomerizing) [Campylobacter lanienae]
MCGIVGYIGKKEKKNIILNGLKELEYRGYDSAGMAIIIGNEMSYYKAVGKLENLASKMKECQYLGNGVAIGHTRWATHGKPTEINAHPHLGEYSFVIHNGIIENYKELKDELEASGVKFLSQTDTEVIVHLFEEYSKSAKTPFEAYKKTISRLKGAYATLLVSKSSPDEIFFAKNAAPLIIARDGDEIYLSSSDSPLIGLAKEAIYLEDGSYGVAKLGNLTIFDENNQEIKPNFTELPKDKGYALKDGYRFFMEKEIYEQSQVIAECLMGRLSDDDLNLDIDISLFNDIDEVVLCACGTSYHAALAASYLLERLAKIRASVVVASEFRYKEPFLNPNSLFIVISQSGETADTLEALKIAKNANLKTLAICNVDNSSIVRMAKEVLLTRAGIEKGVASTKAFATQMICLWMLALKLAKIRHTIDDETLENEIKTLRNIPSVVNFDKSLQEKIYRKAKHYVHGHGFFFIGRDIFYPLALEGALKLKEISYLHAEGYPAGEMKHGPIALADEGLYTIALLPQTILYDKTKSNVEELAARDAFITTISPLEFELSDDFIKINSHSHPMSEFFEIMVVLQLFALEISIRLGNDVDMPRNLAKSVTVE